MTEALWFALHEAKTVPINSHEYVYYFKSKEDKVLEIKDKMSDIVTAADVTDTGLTQAGYYRDAGYNEFDFSCKINGEMDILHMVRERNQHNGRSQECIHLHTL